MINGWTFVYAGAAGLVAGLACAGTELVLAPLRRRLTAYLDRRYGA